MYLVGVYLGSDKPNDSNVYFEDFVAEITPLCRDGLNVNGKFVTVNAKGGIFDAPARSFALQVKYFNAFCGCCKCTTEGEFIERRMCFPVLDSPLRTDEGFVRHEQDDYHRGRTILETVPNFGCVTNVPYDYMHLYLNGVIRKLL